MRIDVDPATSTRQEMYRLLGATVVPRPIAWVSTTGEDGCHNLAPHSFFSVACIDPPMVQFTSVGRKDTLRNVEASGEFVVNFAPEHLIDQVNDTAVDFPAGVDEFEAVRIAPEPSLRVRPPRVADSPVALECVLHSTIRLGDCTMVVGRVVHAAVAAQVLDEGHPEITRLRPLSRLGKSEWGTLGEVREVIRGRYADWSDKPQSQGRP